MFAKQKLNDLQVRRQLLLLESEMNRLTFQAETERLREFGNWTGKLRNLRNKIGPWGGVAAAVGGVVLMMGFRRSLRGLGSLGKAAAVAQPLIHLWRTFKKTPTNEET